MSRTALVLSARQPDPALLKKLAVAKGVLAALVVLIAVVTLAGWFVPTLALVLPNGWQLMNAETALIVLLSAVSLYLSDAYHPTQARAVSLILALVVTLVAGARLIEYKSQVSFANLQLPYDYGSSSPSPARMSPQAAIAFFLLGVAVLLMFSGKKSAERLADLILFFLCFLVLSLISGQLFSALGLFQNTTTYVNAPQTLFCLLLLTLVAVHRQSDDGLFAIFLGRGIGGRIARFASPILLVLPFLRETVRAWLIGAGQIPSAQTTAILASVTAMLALALLLVIVWRIDTMELEIRDLSLRDELTGVYNLRGFTLFAGQALRLAQRSRQPFSVILIELDAMRQIVDDSLRQSMDTAFLAQTGKVLRRTFRDTDVIGRVGRYEFAVGGNFGQMGIELAVRRLHEFAAENSKDAKWRNALNFNLGYFTSEEGKNDSLNDLLGKATNEMYREKRRKEISHQ